MSELHPALRGAADLTPGAPASQSGVAVEVLHAARAESETPTLSTRTLLATGFPHLFGAAMALVIAVFLSKFYVDVVLVPAGVLAVAIAVGRAFDAVVDPFLGYLSDHTNSRWGRRRPWILAGVLGNACAFYALLTPPESLSPTATAGWFGAAFLVCTVCGAMSLVSRRAFEVEMTFQRLERQRLYGITAAFVALGTIVGGMMPTVLRALGVLAPRVQMQRAALVYVIGYLATNAFFLATAKERREYARRGEAPLVPGVRRALRSKPFRQMFLAHTITAIPMSMPAVLMPFYVQYVLKLEGLKWTGLYVSTYLLSGLVCLPLWMYVARRIGKRATWLTLSAVSVFGLVCKSFLGPGDTWVMLTLQAFLGSGFAAMLFLNGAMHADVVDYDELHTGTRREAQFTALWSIIPKFALVAGAAVPLAVLGSVGYVPNAPTQSEEVLMTVRLLFGATPAVFFFGSLLVMWTYPLTEARHRAIREGIRRHEQGQDAVDPLTGQVLPPPNVRAVDAETSWFLDHFSPRELRRLLATGAGPLGIVLAKAGTYLVGMTVAATFALRNISGLDRDPGPLPSIAIVIAGVGCSGLLYHALRIGPARRLARAMPEADVIHAHLSMTQRAGSLRP
ncbi:MAG: MFS transporter [Polyangiales bacterium]